MNEPPTRFLARVRPQKQRHKSDECANLNTLTHVMRFNTRLVSNFSKLLLLLLFTVFRLTQTEYSIDAMHVEDRYLYALRCSPPAATTDTLESAHERRNARIRDNLTDNANIMETILLPNNKNQDVIVPSPAMAQALHESIQAGLQQRNVVLADNSSKSTSTSTSLTRGPKKATTAASFFAKQQQDRKTTSTVVPKKEDTTVASVTKPVAKKEVPAKKKKEAQEDTPAKKEDEKENSDVKKVGNADDFVGDMDDDDDDDDDSVDRKPVAPKVPVRPQPRTVRIQSDNDDDDSEDDKPKTNRRKKEVASGAMDAFVAKPSDSSTAADAAGAGPQPKRRRRKRLVTTTSMDAHGYLHTETHEQWEDILSDEEEIPPKPAAIQPATAATKKTSLSSKKPNSGKSGLKQGSITGFFQKK